MVHTKTSTALLEHLKDTASQASWHAFDARYRPLILAVGRRLGLQDADAEDAAQETLSAFVEAYRQGRYQRQKGRLRDWLSGIARNKIRDVYRKRSNQEKLVPDRTGVTSFWDQIEDQNVDPIWEEEWRKAVLRQCLLEVRQQVSPRTFEAFELFALKRQPAAQVAVHLGVSQDVVYQSKSRVLVRIRELLPDMQEVW